MANKKSSIKDIRKSRKNHEHNRRVRSRVKSLTKKSRAAVAGEGDAKAVASELFSAIDKAAKTNILHKNKVSRLKSRTARAIAAASKS